MCATPNKIRFATFGVGQYNTDVPGADGAQMDVTTQLSQMWASATSYPLSFYADPTLFGASEDAPWPLRVLTVFYNDGTPPDAVWEGLPIRIGAWNPNVPYPMINCNLPTERLSAWWGVPESMRSAFMSDEIFDVSNIVYNYGLSNATLTPTNAWFAAQGVPVDNEQRFLLVLWTNCLGQSFGCSGMVGNWGSYFNNTFVYPTGL